MWYGPGTAPETEAKRLCIACHHSVKQWSCGFALHMTQQSAGPERDAFVSGSGCSRSESSCGHIAIACSGARLRLAGSGARLRLAGSGGQALGRPKLC
eukprot:6473841-Amphidinium_carterae.2